MLIARLQANREALANLFRGWNPKSAPQTNRDNDLASQIDKPYNFPVSQWYWSDLTDTENCLSFAYVQAVNMLIDKDCKKVRSAR